MTSCQLNFTVFFWGTINCDANDEDVSVHDVDNDTNDNNVDAEPKRAVRPCCVSIDASNRQSKISR